MLNTSRKTARGGSDLYARFVVEDTLEGLAPSFARFKSYKARQPARIRKRIDWALSESGDLYCFAVRLPLSLIPAFATEMICPS